MQKNFILTLLLVCMYSKAQSLITNVSVFENPVGQKKQLVIVCGDRHTLGSWQDNLNQFLKIAAIPATSSHSTLFLVENLATPNEYFNRPQDLDILAQKENYIFENLTKHYANEKPSEAPTLLNFFGCSKKFFAKLGGFAKLPQESINELATLPVVNIDNRHRNVYYGESLAGWRFGPYSHPKVREIQKKESENLSILDLLKPQEQLKNYIAKSDGWLRATFEEIYDRQEEHKAKMLRELFSNFKIDEYRAGATAIAKLTQDRQAELFKNLERNDLQYILREMVEANALWHVSQKNANITIILAGSNHTSHTDTTNWIHKTPGLCKFLTWNGYRLVDNLGMTQNELLNNNAAILDFAREKIPAKIAQHTKNWAMRAKAPEPDILPADQATPERPNKNNSQTIRLRPAPHLAMQNNSPTQDSSLQANTPKFGRGRPIKFRDPEELIALRQPLLLDFDQVVSDESF